MKLNVLLITLLRPDSGGDTVGARCFSNVAVRLLNSSNLVNGFTPCAESHVCGFGRYVGRQRPLIVEVGCFADTYVSVGGFDPQQFRSCLSHLEPQLCPPTTATRTAAARCVRLHQTGETYPPRPRRGLYTSLTACFAGQVDGVLIDEVARRRIAAVA